MLTNVSLFNFEKMESKSSLRNGSRKDEIVRQATILFRQNGYTDDETLQANVGAMMESCARFIDFDRIDIVPMSEYLLKT